MWTLSKDGCEDYRGQNCSRESESGNFARLSAGLGMSYIGTAEFWNPRISGMDRTCSFSNGNLHNYVLLSADYVECGCR